jgi:transcriptional regulator with XRE-family HTH domain
VNDTRHRGLPRDAIPASAGAIEVESIGDRLVLTPYAPGRERELHEVVGERVRAIREDFGARQEEVSRAAHAAGIRWARTSITSLEAGAREVSVTELVMIPRILSAVVGRTLTVRDLIPDDAVIRVGADLVVTGRDLRVLLRGELDDRDHPDDHFYPGQGRRAAMRGSARAAARHRRAWPRLSSSEVAEALAAIPEEAERKLARSLQVPVEDVILAARALWGRSVTAERDARADSASHVKRGHVTRRLGDEIRAEIQTATAGQSTAKRRQHGTR